MGVVVPTDSRFAFDIGAVVSTVYVGRPPLVASRGAFDWRRVLRLGLVVDLGVARQ